jgi:hypothetical protein
MSAFISFPGTGIMHHIRVDGATALKNISLVGGNMMGFITGQETNNPDGLRPYSFHKIE